MSKLYPTYKEACLSGDATHASHVAPLTDTIKMALLSSSYVYDDAHQFLSSLTGIVATSPAVTTKTITGGVFDCDDFTFTAVTGATIVQAVLYKDTGTAATSPLMYWNNTAIGLPDPPNGSDITGIVDSGIHKLFEL